MSPRGYRGRFLSYFSFSCFGFYSSHLLALSSTANALTILRCQLFLNSDLYVARLFSSFYMFHAKIFPVAFLLFFFGLLLIQRWGTADAEIKGPMAITRFPLPLSKPVLGQNM